ncbi:DUF3572 family protein [Altererythrobacter salegens]|uniref:DUF3572 family protein n=1 Tax=Croceibacterium salegens TaxID=1737568 RepID=A0A6I4SYH2_9SPHN|nr:DUF3572 domain-containing protein [Croceibacterium salegens]MXO61095.1 DUF3572 family protein [Croceibacterium salegens]
MQALAWLLQDERRAQRFLDLTGLTPDLLRARIETGEVQVSVLDFLCAHEPDLIAAAESLGIDPGQLAAAREALA